MTSIDRTLIDPSVQQGNGKMEEVNDQEARCVVQRGKVRSTITCRMAFFKRSDNRSKDLVLWPALGQYDSRSRSRLGPVRSFGAPQRLVEIQYEYAYSSTEYCSTPVPYTTSKQLVFIPKSEKTDLINK